MNQSHDQQMFILGEWVTLKQGRYRIAAGRCLGEGGQSAVWKAVRESDGKTVVIRTVNLFDISHDRRDIRNDDEIKGLLVYAEEEVNFLKNMGEGQAAQHFILPVLDDGSITHPLFPSHPLPTTVMPWYERGDLGQFVRSRRKREFFSAADLLRWARQLSVALVYIHQQHSGQEVSVHRDLKPKNVVLDSQGNVGLTDFGIVRAAASLGTSSVVGSFLYCAPEQVLATHRSTNRHKQYLITPAVDIYSLAITLHELLAGQTEAQKNLTLKTKDRNTLDEHDSYLPPSGITTTGKIGKLGKIGGLTAKEKQYLHSQILALFNPVTADQTIAVGSKQHSLPDARFIADGMTDLLERMLAPWPADRPTAPEVLAVFTALEQSFNPVLEQLSVSLLQERISVGQACTLQVSVKGVGLPVDGRWLRFECNGQRLDVEISPIVEQTVRVEIPLPAETGEYRLKVSATVAGKLHSQQVVCHVTLTAAQLWELKRYADALRMEFRPEWLTYLLQQATTLDQRIELRNLLKELQKHYSQDKQKQQYLQEAFNGVQGGMIYEPPTFPRWKKWWFILIFGFVIVFFLWRLDIKNSQQISELEQQVSKHFELSNQALNSLKIIKDTSDIDVQRTYYRDLKELVMAGKLHPDVQPEAEQLLESYFNDADMGYKSDTESGTKLALARSTVLAEQEKRIEAMVMVGMIYRSGKDGVVEKNQKIGCDWLKKAGDVGYDLTKVDGYNLTKVDYAKLCPDQ